MWHYLVLGELNAERYCYTKMKPMKIFTITILSILLSAGILQAQTTQGGENRVQLYPNPSTDVVHVTIALPQQETVRLQLYNLLGQIIWSTELGKTQRVETIVPIQQLANGVYLLQVSAGNTIDERKVVVAK